MLPQFLPSFWVNPQLLDRRRPGLPHTGSENWRSRRKGGILRWKICGENLGHARWANLKKYGNNERKGEILMEIFRIENLKHRTIFRKIFDAFIPFSEASILCRHDFRRDFWNLGRPLGIPSTSSSGISGRTGTFSRGSMMGSAKIIESSTDSDVYCLGDEEGFSTHLKSTSQWYLKDWENNGLIVSQWTNLKTQVDCIWRHTCLWFFDDLLIVSWKEHISTHLHCCTFASLYVHLGAMVHQFLLILPLWGFKHLPEPRCFSTGSLKGKSPHTTTRRRAKRPRFTTVFGKQPCLSSLSERASSLEETTAKNINKKG